MTQWGKKNVIKFYDNNRDKVSDLYNSEKTPLSFVKKKEIKSILDYGCAIGGFYKIFKVYFNNKVKYHGLDIEKNAIHKARKKFVKNNRVKFSHIKKGKIKEKKDKYSLSFSTGVLNHCSDYKSIISELVRVSNKYIFIDSPRVHTGKSFVGKLNLSNRFPSDLTVNNIVNNYTINIKDYFLFLKKLFKKNNINRAVFFHGNLPYKKKYLKINKKISFLTFMCEKKVSTANSSFKILTKDNNIKKLFYKNF